MQIKFKKLIEESQISVDDEKSQTNKVECISKKRGRINKNSVINHITGRIHNKYCNDNVRRRIKALYNKYLPKLDKPFKLSAITMHVILSNDSLAKALLIIIFVKSPHN